MFILILTLKIILFLYFLDRVFLGPSKLFITVTINHGDTYKEENSYTIDSIQIISLRIFSFKIGVLIFDFFYFKNIFFGSVRIFPPLFHSKEFMDYFYYVFEYDFLFFGGFDGWSNPLKEIKHENPV